VLKTNRLRLLQPQNLLWLAFPLLLWWFLWRVPFREILGVLGGLSLRAILALTAANLAILALFSARWWLILRSQGYRLPYLSLTGYRLAAFGVTYTTPGPQIGGEPLQAYLLNRRQPVPKVEAVASVMLDKLLELLVNFSFLLFGIGTILGMGLFSSRIGPQALLLPSVLLALPAGYLLALWGGRSPLSGLASRALRRFSLDRFGRLVLLVQASEIEVARFLRADPITIIKAIFLSLVIWIALVFEFGLALAFLGIQATLPQVILILTVSRIAFLLPIPAGLGTLEAGQVLAMQALGFNPAIGLSLSLLIRARDIVLAGVGLWLGGSLSR
jgi:uncharacterized protein (TIRG00374 family)